jgi:endonuclease I
MKANVFYSVWTSYLASRLPCPLPAYTFTKEHVLPKSLFPRVVVDDPRNIIPMPKALNNGRSNFPYTAEWQDGSTVYACGSCPMPGYCRGGGVLSTGGFHPPDVLKGPVARSVLYSVGKHPRFASKIDKEVLRIDTAIEWDSKFPMSNAERLYVNSLNIL